MASASSSSSADLGLQFTLADVPTPGFRVRLSGDKCGFRFTSHARNPVHLKCDNEGSFQCPRCDGRFCDPHLAQTTIVLGDGHRICIGCASRAHIAYCCDRCTRFIAEGDYTNCSICSERLVCRECAVSEFANTPAEAKNPICRECMEPVSELEDSDDESNDHIPRDDIPKSQAFYEKQKQQQQNQMEDE